MRMSVVTVEICRSRWVFPGGLRQVLVVFPRPLTLVIRRVHSFKFFEHAVR